MSDGTTQGQRYRKCESHIKTVVDDELVLMHLESGKFFSLTDTGRAVWERIDRHDTAAALADAMTQRYDVARARALEEIGAVLAKFEERGLIRPFD